MPNARHIWLLVLAVVLFFGPGASRADLKITGTKDFQYRGFSVTGSLNQFLVDHPTFLSDRGFRQSLRLNVSGELTKGVAVDIALDDTNDVERDRKMLITAGGKDFNVTAGRLTLDFPGTRYLVFNKKALAAVVNYRTGDHTLTLMAGRPEGDASRDFFRGLGARAEYLLTQRPVVQGSEIVVLDGRSLQRGSDYDMDYEEGTLILNRRLLPVEKTSTITVEYESQSTGSAFRSTVVGFRDAVRLPKWRAPRVDEPVPVVVKTRKPAASSMAFLREAKGRIEEQAQVACVLVEKGILKPVPVEKPRAQRNPAESILANFGLPGDPLPEPTAPVTVTAAKPEASPVDDEDDEDPPVVARASPASDPPLQRDPAVMPSSLSPPSAGQTMYGGMAVTTLAPGQLPGLGSSSFPGTSAVPVPDAFGRSDASYTDRRPATLPVQAQDDHIGISFVMSTDSDTEESAASAALIATGTVSPTAATTATPRQLGVLGADVTYRFGDGWRLSGEAAGSFLDPNRRVENELSHGLAWDVALAHAGPRWDFRLSRQHLGSGFEAVGKREFTRLGEVADLASDLNATTAHSRFDITPTVFWDAVAEQSETNLSNRVDRPTRDFVGFGNGLSWVFQPQGRVLLRQRDDTSDVKQAGLPDAHVEHRVRAASVTKPIGKMVAQVRAERVEDRGLTADLTGDTMTYAVSLGDSSHRRWKWNLNAADVRFADPGGLEMRDAVSLGGLVDLSLSKYLNGSVSLLDRTERNLITAEEQGTRTGEMRVRYQPFDSLNINTKAAAEERSRIVRQTADPLLALIPQRPGERTLVAEKPVIATNASHTADWQPSRRWDHRLSYRTRDESEVASGKVLSRTDAAGYRVRFAPGTVFRTTTEVETGRSLSKVANFDRDTWLLAQELLWSLAGGLNLSLSYNDNDTRDRTGPGRDRTAVSAAGAERTLGRYFTGLAKLSHTNRIQGGRSDENAVGLGLRYALPHDPVRLQLDGEVAGVEGVNPAGAPFESRRHKAGFRVDGQPVKDLNVECAVTWVRAGANALGDNGYNGFTIESKAFLDF